MNAKISLEILDEVNVRFNGISPSQILYIIKQTSKTVKGAYQTAAFKTHHWDGKESQFKYDGSTFLYMVETVVGLLTKLGYDETQIDLIDRREPKVFMPELIRSDFLGENFTLRDYQIEAVNTFIQSGGKGIIEASTSSGKTLIAAAIVQSYDKAYRSIFITNNDNLVSAAHETYEKVGIPHDIFNSKLSSKAKEEVAGKSRHLITTWQTLKNHKEILKDFGVILYDETHIMGDVMFNLLMKEASNIPVRVGLTATMPRDKQKYEKICCRIGAGVVFTVDYRELADKGWVSESEIQMVQTHDTRDELKRVEHSNIWDWGYEESYLLTNKVRIAKIADYISQHWSENSLILTHAQAGERLAKLLGINFIDGEVDPDIRLGYYKDFETKRDAKLCATFQTVGTGISIDDVFRLFLVDVGKDYTRVVQSIGRGVRLDTEGRNRLKVWDIFADTPISLRHHKERVKIYKTNEYHYNPVMEGIKIE